MTPTESNQRGKSWFELWPLLALCVLGSSRWIVEQAYPSAASSDLSLALGCCAMALVLLLVTKVHTSDPKTPDAGPIAVFGQLVAGGLLLADVALAGCISDRRLHGSDAVLALAFTPVFLSVLLPFYKVDVDLLALLWPGLVGLGGLLLLLPEPSLDTWRYGFALLALPLLMSCALVFADSEQSGRARKASSAWHTQTGQLVAAAVLLAMAGIEQSVHGALPALSAVGLLLDTVTAWLTVLAFARAGTVRFASQFLLVPLLTALEGLLLFRPTLDIRSCLALALVALGAARLFWYRAERRTLVTLR